jgi:CBS domain-containing protein
MVATTVISGLKQFLAAHVPFSQMAEADLDFLAAHVEIAYYAPGETLLAAGEAVADYLWIIRQGAVRGVRAQAGDDEAAAFELGPGSCFPAGALIAERPSTANYTSIADTFCLLLPRAKFDELLRRSDVFFDYCKRRLASLLDLSQRQLRANYAAQADAESTMGTPLADLLHGPAVACTPDTSLRAVFERMQQARIGSMVVVTSGPDGDRVDGIVTRTDLIERVILPEKPLASAVREVMSAPVRTLAADATAADAVLLMAEHSIRHLVVVGATPPMRLLGVVSERDLFALQRLTVSRIATAIQRSETVAALAARAADMRRLSHHLVAQGLGAGPLTRLISRLNDQLTRRLLTIGAAQFGIDTRAFCWLSFGSEGREEQTIATDQDNGIVYDETAISQPVLLELGRWTNDALASCGFPLCKGNIMAGNPDLCLASARWLEKYVNWIDRGDPDSLLAASIYFDLRPLFGRAELAETMHAGVVGMAARNQRFVKQMADNALRNRAPSEPGLLEALLGESAEAPIDLKMHGTVPLVDAARIWALGAGITETNTPRRLVRLREMGRLPVEDVDGWIGAFEFLQLMRLRAQHRVDARPAGDNPNVVDPRRLSSLDRRILKEAFRQARRAQQRLQLDFPG